MTEIRSTEHESQDQARYFTGRNGERFGPYTWSEITAFVKTRQIVPDDLLWGPGFEQWTAAGLVPGLFPPIPAEASPPPIPASAVPRRPLRTTILVVAPIMLLGLVLLVVATLHDGSGGGDAEEDIQAELLGLDDDDWQHYPDLRAERKKIEHSLEEFQHALRDGDVDGAAAWIAEDRRNAYAALFANRPEAMASFADLLDTCEMTSFGPPGDPTADFRLRVAEYTVTVDGFDFYIRLAKMDDTWLLIDF